MKIDDEKKRIFVEFVKLLYFILVNQFKCGKVWDSELNRWRAVDMLREKHILYKDDWKTAGNGIFHGFMSYAEKATILLKGLGILAEANDFFEPISHGERCSIKITTIDFAKIEDKLTNLEVSTEIFEEAIALMVWFDFFSNSNNSFKPNAAQRPFCEILFQLGYMHRYAMDYRWSNKLKAKMVRESLWFENGSPISSSAISSEWGDSHQAGWSRDFRSAAWGIRELSIKEVELFRELSKHVFVDMVSRSFGCAQWYEIDQRRNIDFQQIYSTNLLPDGFKLKNHWIFDQHTSPFGEAGTFLSQLDMVHFDKSKGYWFFSIEFDEFQNTLGQISPSVELLEHAFAAYYGLNGYGKIGDPVEMKYDEIIWQYRKKEIQCYFRECELKLRDHLLECGFIEKKNEDYFVENSTYHKFRLFEW